MSDSKDNPTEEKVPAVVENGERALHRAWPYLRSAITTGVFFAAFWLLYHEFGALSLQGVVSSFRSIPVSSLLAAVALTGANYAVMIGYDAIAIRLINHPVAIKQLATASLLSYAFSNLLGTVLGGTPIRFRLYTALGLTIAEIVRLIFYITLTFWMGLFFLSGLLFIATPMEIPARFHLPIMTSRPAGWILISLVVAFLLTCAFRRRPVPVLGINFQPPPLKYGIAQVAVSSLDLLLAAATLFVLLPNDIAIGFFPFVAVFQLAILVSLVSHVPGGLGVFEIVMIALLSSASHALVASLLAFRIIYYVLPFLIAVVCLAVETIRQNREKASRIAATSVRWASILMPRMMTAAVFLSGIILLISGSLPAAEGRMLVIRRFMPLPIVEISHFLGSVIGALLLVLARGLSRRIDAAWSLTVGLLCMGVVVSLAKGFDYEEAIFLAIVLVALIPCRAQFFRHGRLFAAPLNAAWISAIVMSLGLLIWLILFAFRHVEYRDELWWSFAYNGDAPRALRGFVGAATFLMIIFVARLLLPNRTIPDVATETEFEEAAAIVRSEEPTFGNLALLGDKRFIFSHDRKAFVMFGCEGNSWIAMGDPVGPTESADDAAWKFREACDSAGVWPVFYQVDENALSRYVDMGLSMIKLGEEARVPLKDFSLTDSSHKDLRRTNRKAGEEGLRFEIVPRERIEDLMPQLKMISDAWLSEKSAAEKGFSLGAFNETYLRRCDIALILLNDSPVAFANLWLGANKRELSIDLMRYLPSAPRSVMEFLFIQLMQWGHDQGYEWFNLGMAPLSGIDSHRLGPVWNRVSSIVFHHGEKFYNFQGLRSYKSKFNPKWFPKYLASPGGLASARILANVSTLISGGFRRLLHR